MKNNLLPVALLLGGGFYLFRWLRNKQDAGSNLKYEPVDIAIDTERSQAANFFQIYYKVKIRLINDGRASVNVRDIDLVASAGNTRISNITSSTQFVVPANSSKVIQLTASISTAGIVNTLLNIIEDGINIPITVTGQILTDLGTLNITFTKVIGAPTMGKPKNNKVKFKYNDKVNSYQNPSTPGYVRFIRESDDPNFDHKYKLALIDNNGYSYSSNWINEKSLSKKKLN
jgi:hypothetical protein